mgnify:CR=1 FL=1
MIYYHYKTIRSKYIQYSILSVSRMQRSETRRHSHTNSAVIYSQPWAVGYNRNTVTLTRILPRMHFQFARKSTFSFAIANFNPCHYCFKRMNKFVTVCALNVNESKFLTNGICYLVGFQRFVFTFLLNAVTLTKEVKIFLLRKNKPFLVSILGIRSFQHCCVVVVL